MALIAPAHLVLPFFLELRQQGTTLTSRPIQTPADVAEASVMRQAWYRLVFKALRRAFSDLEFTRRLNCLPAINEAVADDIQSQTQRHLEVIAHWLAVVDDAIGLVVNSTAERRRLP